MRIRSGRNNILPPGGTQVPLPQNRGMSRIAQAAIDTLATVAVRKSVEAIRTDAWPVYCHVSQNGSDLCSCHKDKGGLSAESVDANDDLSLIVEDTLSPEDSINGQSFKTSVRLRGFGVQDNLLESNTSNKPAKPKIEDLTSPGLVDTSIDGNYPPQPDSDFSDILSIFPSLGQKQCGICGGAGYVDAWRWVSGQKLFLLPEYADYFGGVAIDKSTRPWTAAFSDDRPDTYLQWTVDIPAYFIQFEAVKIKDNVTLCTEFIFEARDPAILNDNDPLAWARFDNVFIQPYVNTGIRDLKVRIRMKSRKLQSGTYASLTHGEVWIKTNELPYCQFPQIDRDIQGGTLEALISTQFEIDPGVGRLSRGSLIENPNQGRMWLVSQVTNKETSKRYVFNVAGVVTVLSSTDAPYGLAMVPRFSGKSPRHWRGVEVGPEGQGMSYEGGYINVGQFENAGPLAGTRDKPYDDVSVVTQDKADRP